MDDEIRHLRVQIDKAEGYEPSERVAKAIENLARSIVEEEGAESDVEGFARRGLDLGGLSVGQIAGPEPLEWELCLGFGPKGGCTVKISGGDGKLKM